jgi:two-component system alkaline phosphatase synthesis response regulator PhoP
LRRSQLDRARHAASAQVGDLRLDLGQRTLTIHDELVELTPTEFKLLWTLMENPGYVFTRDELMEKALEYAFEGAGRPLDSHIKNLRNKIEPDTKKPTYIQVVYGVGYRFIKG